MAERALTVLELNRALLARQGLLGRTDTRLPFAVEGMGGIQAQYSPASYVGLWSRVRGFRRSDLDQALTRRTVVQGTLLRATIHVVSARDYWPWALAIRQARRDWFLRVERSGLTARSHERSAAVVADALAGRSMSQVEIEALVGPTARSGIGMFVDLVRVPPSGTWTHRRADLFALATDWVGPEPDLAADEAVELLVRRYLGAFGPARRRDIATWAGLPVGRVRPVLEQMDLCRFTSADGDELVDGGPRCCRRSTGRGSSPRATRSPSGRSWSTVRWQRCGVFAREPSRSRSWARCRPRCEPRSGTRASD